MRKGKVQPLLRVLDNNQATILEQLELGKQAKFQRPQQVTSLPRADAYTMLSGDHSPKSATVPSCVAISGQEM